MPAQQPPFYVFSGTWTCSLRSGKLQFVVDVLNTVAFFIRGLSGMRMPHQPGLNLFISAHVSFAADHDTREERKDSMPEGEIYVQDIHLQLQVVVEVIFTVTFKFPWAR